MRPKEWNSGQHVEQVVAARPKSMRASACATLASMLRWERTTPFGAPSEPEVNRIDRPIVGLARNKRLLRLRTAPRSLSAKVTVRGRLRGKRVGRRSDAGDQFFQPALFDEGMRGDDGSTCAARQAASTLAAPAVKLIIAGTRPADINASTRQRHRSSSAA